MLFRSRHGEYLAARLQPMEATRIQLCGRMTVEIEGRRLEDKLPGRQGRLLLAYLAANRLRPVDRGELASVLWPDDSPPMTAEATLTGVLSRLRQGKSWSDGTRTRDLRRDRRRASSLAAPPHFSYSWAVSAPGRPCP